MSPINLLSRRGRFLTAGLLFGCLVWMVSDASADTSASAAKILNGPPQDFSQMRLPDPESMAKTSKGVEKDLSPEALQDLEIPTDAGFPFKVTLIGTDEQLDGASLQLPDGRWLKANDLPTTKQAGTPTLLKRSREAGFTVLQLEAAGEELAHKLRFGQKRRLVKRIDSAKCCSGDPDGNPDGDLGNSKGDPDGNPDGDGGSGNGDPDGNPDGIGVSIRVENQSPYEMRVTFGDLVRRAGAPVRFSAQLIADAGAASIAGLERGRARLMRADGWSRELDLEDADAVKCGLVGWSFTPEQAGRYALDIELVGRDADGRRIERNLRTTMAVSPGTLRLIDGLTKAKPSARLVRDDRFGKAMGSSRVRFDLPVQISDGAPERVVAHAELWGRDAQGRSEAVAWLGGIKELRFDASGEVTLPLGFDGRWFQRSSARPPFELRSLRLQDVDTFEVLATVDRVKVDLDVGPSLFRAYAKGASMPTIDRTMLYGPAPKSTRLASTMKNGLPVERLVLSHGYCGGKTAWGPYANHFWATNDAHGRNKVHLFHDPEQGRSHDQFAQQLMAFIDNRPDDAYSIIGLSQGGVAAVHLLAFYHYEPLESSAATFKVQTVASPWGGSPLMDTLVTLQTSSNPVWSALRALVGGMWKCPAVENLTSDGAALWRSSLPPSVLEDVRFYRAKGGSVPCNVVAAAVINGDDDGVVSVTAQGHVGVSNGGLKTEQCHMKASFFNHDTVASDRLRNEQMARFGRTWYLKTCLEVQQDSGFAPANVQLDSSCTILRPDVLVRHYQWTIRPSGEEGSQQGGEYFATGPSGYILVDQPGEYTVELAIEAFVDGQWRVDKDTRPLRVAGDGIPLCVPGEHCPWLCENPLDCPGDEPDPGNQ